jgi:hypothetical protein
VDSPPRAAPVPPHHFQVHSLLLLVALIQVHITLVVPLVIWILDVIIIVHLQLVRNLVGDEPPNCPETKKYLFKTNYMILLKVFCVQRI